LHKTITIRVGKAVSQNNFTVHEDVICAASPFFKAACKPEWMKPEEKVVNLPEDDAEVIRIMIYWIYHDEICIAEVPTLVKGCTIIENFSSPSGLFIKLYVAAQKYQMPRLQNAAIDALLYHQYNQVPLNADLITWVYENTAPDDKLRELNLLLARQCLSATNLKTHGKFFCVEFLLDMTKAFVEQRELGDIDPSVESLYGDEGSGDFCRMFHVKDGCDGECVAFKLYIEHTKEK